MRKRFSQVVSFLLLGSLTLTQMGCQTTSHPFEPLVTCQLPSSRLQTMPSAFPPFSENERQQEWAKEILMGDVFARECDFYRAITCYRRAQILLPPQETCRTQQVDYDLILSYYLGNKYQEALNIFESGCLSQATASFPAFNQLLLVVYDCYLLTQQEDKAACVLEAIRQYSPETSADLSLYQALKGGEIDEARCLMAEHRESEEMEMDFAVYDQFAKSPRRARTLNAILPGAGYFYVGQRKSALTSFLINALFTAAAYQFFHRGYPAAGAITASLELGWYVGGINGAGIEATEFNARLYEGVSKKILTDHACFPVLMFETSF